MKSKRKSVIPQAGVATAQLPAVKAAVQKKRASCDARSIAVRLFSRVMPGS
jgi:hypothetical protein